MSRDDHLSLFTASTKLSPANPFLDRAASPSPPPPITRKPIRVPTNSTLYAASSVQPTSSRNSIFSEQPPPSYRPPLSPPQPVSPVSEYSETPAAYRPPLSPPQPVSPVAEYSETPAAEHSFPPNDEAQVADAERVDSLTPQRPRSLRHVATLPGKLSLRRRLRATSVIPILVLILGIAVLVVIVVALKVSKAGQRP